MRTQLLLQKSLVTLQRFQNEGKSLENLIWSTRRLFPDINNPQFQLRSAAERQAVNSVIQGTGADLIKMSLLLIEKQLRDQKLGHLCTVVLSIHDELLFEVEEKYSDKIANLIKNSMESVCSLDVS